MAELKAWSLGLLPDYYPSRGDLYLLASDLFAVDPVAIVGVPTRR